MKAKRFLQLSATDFLPRCKYKKNLANDVHCELYFLQKYGKNPNSSTLRPSFLSKNVRQTKKRSPWGLPLLSY